MTMNPTVKKIQLVSKLPAFQVQRAVGSGFLYPVNITISLLYSCNSRCRTCNVYLKQIGRAHV